MALPAFSTYRSHRYRNLGIQLAWKREQQCRRREQCALDAKYFRDLSVINHFHSEWTSRQYFEHSMAAYSKQKIEEDKINNLEQRRMRLKHMLEEEQKQMDAELDLVVPHRCAMMRRKADATHSMKEERRKKLAQELLKEHRKKSNLELQQVETASEQHQIVKPLQRPLTEMKQQDVKAQEMCSFPKACERTQRKEIEEIEQAEEIRKLEENERSQEIHKKMEQLKLMEEEATHLKKEEETLQVELWQLENMEVERRTNEERRKKAEMRNFLIRQYRAQLRRRAQQVQEELESDHKILAALLKGEQEQEQVKRSGARRERVFADASWLNRMIEEQLELEREREAEFDLLHREEAQRAWEQREAIWERERKARELLMQEVLAGRRQYLELKKQNNREAQLESLRKREELIQELELNTSRGKKSGAKEKQTCKRTEEQQLQEQWEEQCRIEDLQEEEEEDPHLIQEEALKQKIINNAYQPKVNSKPRVAWT
ncbi:trichoplein keratin filament-binding protein [Syngnathus scovelli]|uniref:trichoplein keratin filament-binding protein n=1 Tax=Syngnathus scovelli TaxID=161590 RepID=UPI0021105548|nr:trichoplein keratin filament-binding protein [Syngnathus scovelli]